MRDDSLPHKYSEVKRLSLYDAAVDDDELDYEDAGGYQQPQLRISPPKQVKSTYNTSRNQGNNSPQQKQSQIKPLSNVLETNERSMNEIQNQLNYLNNSHRPLAQQVIVQNNYKTPIPKVNRNEIDIKQYQEELINKVKQGVANDIQSEVLKLLENKNNFYQLLTQKVNNKRKVQDSEYDNIVQRNTVNQNKTQDNQSIGGHLSRNYNHFQKIISQQNPRRILDPNNTADYLDQKPANYLILPKINLTQQEKQKYNISKIPIKTNIERLNGVLYKNIDDTMEYYDKRIMAERFLSIHGPKQREEYKYNINNKYNDLIYNKRYEKLMSNSSENDSNYDKYEVNQRKHNFIYTPLSNFTK